MGESSDDERKVKVFLSYAHRDGASLARRLHEDLVNLGVCVWMDERRLQAGRIWSEEIEREIDGTDYVLALCSLASFHSPICRGEQLRALKRGKKLIPVLVKASADIPVFLEPYQYIDLQEASYAAGFATLVELIREGKSATLKATYRALLPEPPSLPIGYVERPIELAALRALVLREPEERMAVTAVRGMPGTGKSVLVTALMRDPAVVEAFPDGLVWVGVGQEPDALKLMRDVTEALREPWGNHLTMEEASRQMRRLLREHAALLVLDDVWNPAVAHYFWSDLAASSALLITTRKESVTSQTGASELTVGPLTESQALALISKRCQRPSQQLPPLAAHIVQECGYLALAIAIVGARLRAKPDAVWSLVLQQLKTADLEHLGNLEEYPHRGIFRAIQTSVEDLEPMSRERYRSISVFPEEVPVPPSVFKLLWAADDRDVLLTLEAWADRSLAEFDVESRVRFHDLLLDYAKRLNADLAAVTALHKTLTAAYRAQSKGNGFASGWADVPDDGYYRQHIAYHLEAAQEHIELHRLLGEQTPTGQNSWYEARAGVGDTAGYLADIQRAWRLARAVDVFSQEERAEGVALQVRYACIVASVQTIVINIPIEFWAAAVKRHIVSASDAVSEIQQISDEGDRARALLAIVGYLEEPGRRETIQKIWRLADCIGAENGTEVLLGLVPHLSGAEKQQALEAARSAVNRIDAESALVRALALLAEYAVGPPRKKILREALKRAKAITDERERADTFASIAAHLPEALLRGALKNLHGFEDDEARAWGFTLLAPFCTKAVRSEVVRFGLAAAREFIDEQEWSSTLVPLLTYCPQSLRRGVTPASTSRATIDLLTDLGTTSPGIADSLLHALLESQEAIGSWWRAEALIRLSVRLVESGYVENALAAASAVDDAAKKARALANLVPYLSNVLKNDVLRMGMDALRASEIGTNREEALAALAPHLDGASLREAFVLARQIRDDSDKVGTLAATMAYLPKSFEEEKAEVLRKALATAEQLPELATEDSDLMSSPRGEALAALAPHLPESLLLKILNRLPSADAAKEAIVAALACRWAELGHRREALDMAMALRDKMHHARTLVQMVSHLGGTDKRKAVDAANDAVWALDNRYARLKILPQLAGHLSQEQLYQALNIARTQQTEVDRAETIEVIAPYLSQPLLLEALDVARAIELPFWKVLALVALAPRLGGPPKEEVLREAVRTACTSNDYSHNDRGRGQMLARLSAHLPEALLGEALESAQRLGSDGRMEAMVGMAPRLAELGKMEEALAAAQQITVAEWRAATLAAMLSHLPQDLRSRVLANTLIEACYLPHAFPQLAERAKVLGSLIPHLVALSPANLYALWNQALPLLAARARQDLLGDVATLLPIIHSLGGARAVAQTAGTVVLVTRWWP